MILSNEKLSATTSDINLDCFDSELSWLQMVPVVALGPPTVFIPYPTMDMVPSTTKTSQNSSDLQRNEEILTLTLHPTIFRDVDEVLIFLSKNQLPEDLVHQCRKKKQEYRKYQGRDLLNAIEEVRIGGMSVIKASRKYGVPQRTLHYRLKKIRDGYVHKSSKYQQ